MRNPNGYGGITKLTGNRRNPYRVRITAGWEYDEKTGRHRQQYSTLGYFPTRRDAMMALAAYNANPYDINAKSVTFADMFYKYISNEDLTDSMKSTYKAAFKCLLPLHNMKMSDIKKMHLQDALNDNAGKSTIYLTKIRGLIKNIFAYCIDNDILEKDYSQNLKINGSDKKDSIHKPFTTEEIKILWDSLNMAIPLRVVRSETMDIYPVDTILMLIYTGMRPGELRELKTENVNIKERYLIGGIKTEAGINRIIPLHDDIVPLFEKRVNAGNEYLIPYKVTKPPSHEQYANRFFKPVIKKLNMQHLPHDGRHTFATFADKFIEDKFMTKRIMGHTIKDLTQNVYTHKDIPDMLKEVNKIKFT